MSETGSNGGGELLTLTEVSNRTGISMPTLQRYKKEYQSRIPSVGRGRKQRYPVESLEVFEQLKSENIKRRGRPRGSGGGGGGRRAASKSAAPSSGAASSGASSSRSSSGGGGDLLTLTEIGERTGISYPTLVRYVKLHGDEIPSEGEGRRRRYHPQAVEVFQRLRSESGRGRKPKGGRAAAAPARVPGGASAAGGGAGAGDGKLAQRVASLERTQERLERQIQEMIQLVRKPITVTVQRAK